MQPFSMAAPQPNVGPLPCLLQPTTLAFTTQQPSRRHQLQHVDAARWASRKQGAKVIRQREIHRNAVQDDEHRSLIAELGACAALCIPSVTAFSRRRVRKQQRLRRHRDPAAGMKGGCIALDMTVTNTGLINRLRAILPNDMIVTNTGLINRLRAILPKAPTPKEIGRLGVGFGMAFSFLGGLNLCIMIAVSWPLFILRTGGSPLLFNPFTFNPLYIAYFSAIYFAYGTVTTPPLVAAAAALSPAFNWMLQTLRKRFGVPYWLAMILLQIGSSFTHVGTVIGSVLLGCAIAGTPVWV